MRWKALFLLLGLLVFLGLLCFVFLDSIVGWSIEHALETALGVKVEIDHLHIDLIHLKVSIAKLQIANPNNTWRNLIETNDINFQMAWEPLFTGKIVIEDLALTDLMINTQRKTDGRIKKIILPGPFGQAQQKLNRDIASLPVLDSDILQKQIPVDQLMASYQLKTELATVEVRQNIENTNLDWQNNLKKLPEINTKLNNIQNQFQQLKTAPQPKNIIELNNRLQTIQNLQKSVGEVQSEISQTSKNLTNDFDGLKNNIGNLSQTAQSDIQAVLKLAKLPDFSSFNISEILLGKGLLNESSFMMNMVDNLQKKIPVSLESPPKEEHPRGGQDIIFPGRKNYPQLLIKRIFISAKGTPATVFNGFYAKGTASGITSEPQIYGKPMLMQVNAKASNQAFLDFNGSLNHITPAINDTFALTLGNLPISGIQLPESGLLPDQIIAGTMSLTSNFQIESDRMQLVVQLGTENLKCSYSPKNLHSDLLGQIVQETLTGMDHVTLEYRLEGISNKLTMKISSNIDQQFNQRFNAIIGAKIEKAKQEIQARVDKVLLEKQKELETLRLSYQKNIETQLNQVQDKISKEQQQLNQEKQKLEDQVNQQFGTEKQKQEQTQKDLLDKTKQDLENKLKSQLPKIP